MNNEYPNYIRKNLNKAVIVSLTTLFSMYSNNAFSGSALLVIPGRHQPEPTIPKPPPTSSLMSGNFQDRDQYAEEYETFISQGGERISMSLGGSQSSWNRISMAYQERLKNVDNRVRQTTDIVQQSIIADSKQLLKNTYGSGYVIHELNHGQMPTRHAFEQGTIKNIRYKNTEASYSLFATIQTRPLTDGLMIPGQIQYGDNSYARYSPIFPQAVLEIIGSYLKNSFYRTFKYWFRYQVPYINNPSEMTEGAIRGNVESIDSGSNVREAVIQRTLSRIFLYEGNPDPWVMNKYELKPNKK